MTGRVPTALAALVACAGPSGADRDAYVASLGDGPAACAAIAEATLRDECTALAVPAALEGADAHAACDGIAQPTWRQECHFRVIERSDPTGPDAVAACHTLGRNPQDCIDHLSFDEVAAVRSNHGEVGAEAALTAALSDLTARWYPDLAPDQWSWNADALAAYAVAARSGTAAFDESACGVASERVCAWAYLVALDARPADPALADLCAGPVRAERVTAAGLLGFSPPDAPFAAHAWRELCASVGRKKRAMEWFPFGARPLLRGPLLPPGTIRR